MNTEAVGLIHAKADLFVATLLLGSLLLFKAGRRHGTAGKPALWLGSLVCYALALFTKETAFLYPLLITFLCVRDRRAAAKGPAQTDEAPRGSRREETDPILAPKRGVLLFTMTVWLATLLAVAMRLTLTPASTYASPLPLWERLLTFGTVYLEYLSKLAIPVHLSVGDTVSRFTALPSAFAMGAVLILACVVLAQIGAARRWPRLRPWIGLYNLSLLPVFQIVPILHFKADRFLYLPSLAFTGACIEGVLVWRASATGARLSPAGSRRVLLLGLLGLASTYACLVIARTRDFRTDETLFQNEVSRTPDYREGLSMLGRGCERRGEFARSELYYRRSLEPRPGRISFVNSDAVVVNLSSALLAQYHAQEAYEFIQASEARVKGPRSRQELDYNRAVAAFKLRRFVDALPLFQAYSFAHPKDARSRFLEGVCAFEQRRDDVARAALRAYLALMPDAPDRQVALHLLTELDARTPRSP